MRMGNSFSQNKSPSQNKYLFSSSLPSYKLIPTRASKVSMSALPSGYLGDPSLLSKLPEKVYDDDDDDDADGYLHLCPENVEKVLDELRPYLIADGGNVKLVDIDGPIVKVELEGACGTCPSSTVTLKMGLERGLMEQIPEIQAVV